jgi:hypothetical protein
VQSLCTYDATTVLQPHLLCADTHRQLVCTTTLAHMTPWLRMTHLGDEGPLHSMFAFQTVRQTAATSKQTPLAYQLRTPPQLITSCHTITNIIEQHLSCPTGQKHITIINTQSEQHVTQSMQYPNVQPQPHPNPAHSSQLPQLPGRDIKPCSRR